MFGRRLRTVCCRRLGANQARQAAAADRITAHGSRVRRPPVVPSPSQSRDEPNGRARAAAKKETPVHPERCDRGRSVRSLAHRTLAAAQNSIITVLKAPAFTYTTVRFVTPVSGLCSVTVCLPGREADARLRGLVGPALAVDLDLTPRLRADVQEAGADRTLLDAAHRLAPGAIPRGAASAATAFRTWRTSRCAARRRGVHGWGRILARGWFDRPYDLLRRRPLLRRRVRRIVQRDLHGRDSSSGRAVRPAASRPRARQRHRQTPRSPRAPRTAPAHTTGRR